MTENNGLSDAEIRQLAERDLRSSFERSLPEQLNRRLRVTVQQVLPMHFFSFALVECRDMFVAGHFYGCITLCQSVAEGLSKFLVEKNQNQLTTAGQRARTGKDFADRVRRLAAATVITSASEQAFLRIHASDRNDFHHLNHQIPTDVKKLEQRAAECLAALSEVESDVFGYGFNQGAVAPRLPHHWPIGGDRLVDAYIRPPF